MNLGSWRLPVGVGLDIAGLGLIAASLEGGGPLLLAGLGCLIVGLLLVTSGRRTEPPPSPEASARSLKRWRPEPALARPAPRPARLRSIGWLTLGAWTLMFAALGYFAWERVWSLNPPVPSQPLLEAQGEETWGTVHRKETRENAAGETKRYLSYHFGESSGAGLRSTIVVTPSVYERFSEGDAVKVVFLPGDPQAHYLPEITRRPLMLRAVLMGAVVAVAFGILLAVRAWKHWRLVRAGTPVGAVVENLKRRGGAKAVDLRYRVGERDYTLRAVVRDPALKSGDVRTVLYAPGKPADAELYALCFFEASG